MLPKQISVHGGQASLNHNAAPSLAQCSLHCVAPTPEQPPELLRNVGNDKADSRARWTGENPALAVSKYTPWLCCPIKAVDETESWPQVASNPLEMLPELLGSGPIPAGNSMRVTGHLAGWDLGQQKALGTRHGMLNLPPFVVLCWKCGQGAQFSSCL